MTAQGTSSPVDYPAGAGPMPEISGVAVEHEFYDLPSGRFHVARAGDRSLPAIMLVHGFPQHWWSWRGVVQELASEAHLIMPDLRGSGWSSVPTEKGSYRKSDMAADLAGLLDAMEIDQIAIASHDWGAFLSQILAVDAPERVSRLLALSIAPPIPVKRPPLRSAARMYYQLVFSAPGSSKLMFRNTAFFARGLRQDVQQKRAFTHEDALVFARPYADPTRAQAAQLMYRSFVMGDAAALMKRMKGKRFTMPVRFVLSKFDAYIPPEFAQSALGLGPQVQAIVQDRTGHFLPDEDPAYTAEQIREFLLPAAKPVS
ncbi:MAG: alpha/beta hydrolase [Solirubrobacteraceae bacterium]|nr:alpha/beta hydrolase [Solirubrobacteraceae bacterium]